MTPRSLTMRSLALIGACLLGACMTAAAYWPGFMTWDAIRQYDQATSGDFDDWHPPMMEWLWRRLLSVHAGPAPMLLVQLALEWGGLAMLGGWALRGGRPRLALAIVACGFMPFALALTGEVLKDCLMAGALLGATGLLAWQDDTLRPGAKSALALGGIALLVFAATLRFNAFLATVPPCVALLPHALRRTAPRLAASILLSAALMVAALPVANRLIGARASDVSLSLVIFDLGGITAFGGVDAFPRLAVADPVAANARCYDPERWDSYSWWVDPLCPIDFDSVRRAFRERHVNPYRFWAQAVAAHPIAYAQHRLTHFNIAVRLFSRAADERPVQIAPPPNDWRYTVTPAWLLTAIDRAAVWSGGTPLGWPAVWIALALGLLWLSRNLPSRRVVLPLAASAVLYGLGYAVFGVASELRYQLWTMLATGLAAAIALGDIAGAPVPRSRLVLAGALPVAVLTASCGWRLLVPA